MPGYKNLLTFKQCTEILDLTYQFCKKFLPGREMLRQRDQMVQAARSAKQCIAEGASQGTSLKGYIKMVGVSRGSLEEILEDYKDLARRWDLEIWDKEDRRLKEMGKKVKRVKRKTGKHILPSSPSSPSKPSVSSKTSSASYPLNYLIDLTTRTCYLLDKQRKALEKKFVEEGGYTETLYWKRINYRKKKKRS